jgi:23S rRNA-/tRNA-specific pseudouridylate synthase
MVHACRQAVVHRVLKELGRPALHAKTLGFEHPRSKERLSFTSELPYDFAGALQSLRSL